MAAVKWQNPGDPWGHPVSRDSWKLNDILPTGGVQRLNIPAAYTYLSDRVAHAVSVSNVTVRLRHQYWPDDFNAQGKIRPARENRGPAALDAQNMYVTSGGYVFKGNDQWRSAHLSKGTSSQTQNAPAASANNFNFGGTSSQAQIAPAASANNFNFGSRQPEEANPSQVIEDLRQMNNVMGGRNEDLTEQLAGTLESFRTVTQEKENLQVQKKALEGHHNKVSRELTDLRNKHENALVEHQNTVGKLQAEAEDARRAASKTQQDYEQQCHTTTRLQQQLQVADNRLQIGEDQVNRLQKEISFVQSDHGKLAEELKDSDNLLRSYKQKYEQSETSRQTLSNDLRTKETELKRVTAEQAQSAKTIAELEARVNDTVALSSENTARLISNVTGLRNTLDKGMRDIDATVGRMRQGVGYFTNQQNAVMRRIVGDAPGTVLAELSNRVDMQERMDNEQLEKGGSVRGTPASERGDVQETMDNEQLEEDGSIGEMPASERGDAHHPTVSSITVSQAAQAGLWEDNVPQRPAGRE